MRNAILLILVVIALLAAGPAALADKTTVDPNTAAVREAEEKSEAEVEVDARLDQKVTYEARRETIVKVLADLAEMTGVDFKAGQNNKDWQSRDTRMNIFAKDIPFRALMTSMARTMKFKWTREKVDGKFVYRLYMPRRTQLEADDRKGQEEEARQRRIARKRESAFDAYMRSGSLSPQELEKLKKDSPFLYAVGKSGITGPMGQFLSGCPAATDALMNGTAAYLSAGGLSAAAQQGLVGAMQAMWKMENAMMGRMNRTFPDDLAGNMGQISISINRHLEESRGFPGSEMMLGELEMRFGEHHMQIPLIDPESEMAKVIGKAIVKSTDEGVPMQDAMRESQAEMMKAFTADAKAAGQGEETNIERPDDPSLHKKITLKPDSPQLVDIEADLARKTEFGVVADCYGVPVPALQQLSAEETELKDILNKVGEAYLCNWEKRGKVIEISDPKWFEKRAAMIPEAWLENWRETLKKTGTLDIGDLAQMASLTQEQTMANVQQDETLRRCGLPWSFYSAREAIRLYGVLSEEQQSALFGAGVDLRALSPEQWAKVEKLVSSTNVGLLTDQDVRLIMTATRKPVEKRFEYKFTINTGEEPITWGFTTPEYREPPKPVPKPEPAKAEEPKAVEPKPAEPSGSEKAP